MLAVSELLLIVGVALTTGILAVTILGNRPRVPATPDTTPEEPVALIFEDGVLHHATQRALQRFAFLPGANVWDDLRDDLLSRFPDFPATAGTCSSGMITVSPALPDDSGCCRIQWRDRLCWVEIAADGEAEGAEGSMVDPARPQEGIATLFCDTLDQPAWEIGRDGQIAWRNAAFDSLTDSLGIPAAEHPLALPGCKDQERLALSFPDGREEWYSVSRHTIEETTLCHATNVTALVDSERAQATFVQTLAKTFAHLSIGLAIFDREGRLSIFNPALVDLTRLKPSFLAGQPTMMSFFDALRENRAMPEPKNYRSWRQEITVLIDAASDNKYRETWSLEDGRTFVVQGRPHPDGATAFMIEDISTEITLTRNFRVEVEQYEALLDSTSDGLVVFSSNGVLTFCNAAYRQMWDQNPEAAFADVTILDAIALWERKAGEDESWSRIAAFVTAVGARKPLTLSLACGSSGPVMTCEMQRIASDGTMLRFLPVPAATKDLRVPEDSAAS